MVMLKASWLLFTLVLIISSVLLCSVASLGLGDDRYDYDQCARRCWDRPAHERQVCVAACSRRHRHRHDEGGESSRPPVDPRHEVERCRERCESQGTAQRCRIRCEELYGDDRGSRDVDMTMNQIIGRDKYWEEQVERECEQQCVSRLGEQKQLQCHQRCVEMSKYPGACQFLCQLDQDLVADPHQCPRICRDQLLDAEEKAQDHQTGGTGTHQINILHPKSS